MNTRYRPTGTSPRIQNTVRLSAEGIAKILGDLEARIMHAIWELDVPSTARVVHARVVEDHRVALHTVITVLNKLVSKGLLTRAKRNDLLHYEARLSEGEFRVREARRVVEGILSLGEQEITTSFVDILAERNPTQLPELLELVRRRMRS